MKTLGYVDGDGGTLIVTVSDDGVIGVVVEDMDIRVELYSGQAHRLASYLREATGDYKEV